MLAADSDSPPIAISLNFDSLNEAYRFPYGYRDVSFFHVFDRLAAICARYAFPLSIYIVGRDLLNPEHAARVRDWSTMGHEIGNHSWSHHFNLASLPASQVREEIVRAHSKITDCIGREPRGFTAPAWATSGVLVETLLDLKYEYDTSAFPSILFFPMIAKVVINHWSNPFKALRVLHRKDWHGPFLFPNEPFYLDRRIRIHRSYEPGRILVLPVPARTRFAPAIWHTLGFSLGWNRVFKGIRDSSKRAGFYYLIHPADFIGPEDLDPRYRQSLARMQVPLDEKLTMMDRVFAELRGLGRPVRTMAEVARHCHVRLLTADRQTKVAVAG